MKILVFLGSPKKAGRTAWAVTALGEEMKRRGHRMETVFLADCAIAGCRGCNGCFGPKEEANCVVRDDAIGLFAKMSLADAVVYASPLYAWSFPAQAKAFLDRHYCLVTDPGTEGQSSLAAGKKVAMLLTCSEGKEGNADLAATCFERLFGRLKSTVAGEWVLDRSGAPDFEARASAAAKNIADSIVG